MLASRNTALQARCRSGVKSTSSLASRQVGQRRGDQLISQATRLSDVLPMKQMAAAAACFVLSAGPALAFKDVVTEFTASGFLFKDTIEVIAIDDPEVKGVTLYLSDFKRNIVDKLKKDFFTEPSQASLTCAATGPVHILDEESLRSNSEGREIFEERKGLNLFKDKTLRIRRVYDSDRKTLIYVAYRTSFTTASDEGGVSTGRYRTSVCAIPVITNQVTGLELAYPDQ